MSEVKQLISRLDNARNDNERLTALESLNSFCRGNAGEGIQCLSRVLELLHEEGSNEEYQECLDILFKLIKFDAQGNNIGVMLGDPETVELLLDLLEHEDLTVGVMTAQVLSQFHVQDPRALEAAIQLCPNGMNKLLQILPDRSREEVSNQAIILIQQLTADNEEMKKTVAFNEGFETIFSIIRSEGGAVEANIVVEDCLKICSNTLANSETCQRLFHGMGGGWHLALADFFDPSVLENISAGRDGDDETPPMWFEHPHKLNCAVLAVHALYNSIGDKPNKKHQAEIALRASTIVTSAAFWLTRRGPLKLVQAVLLLLRKLCEENAEVSIELFSAIVQHSPPQKGKVVPLHAHTTPLVFSWRPVPSDDRRLITLPSLLLDRYLFGSLPWNPLPEYEIPPIDADNLLVLDALLAADPAASRLVVQFILAPPPPPQDDDVEAIESAAPFGTLVLNTLLEGISRLLGLPVANSSRPYGGSLEVGERAANVLATVFIHGDELARELTTVLHTGHTVLAAPGHGVAATPLLSFLLSLAGKCIRIGEPGYASAVALLRMLSTAVFCCEKGARQMLDDPANLFILDIASSASDAAGVPKLLQVATCLFLGACYQALREEDAEKHSSSVSKASLLSMIDGRIGLTRFTELLKLPLSASKTVRSQLSGFLFIGSFQVFYERLVEAVIQSLFEHFSTGAVGTGEDSPEKQIIALQLARIAELEAALSDRGVAPAPVQTHSLKIQADMEELVAENAALRSQVTELGRQQAVAVADSEEVTALKKAILDLTEERTQLRLELNQSKRKVQLLEEDLQSPVPFEKARDKKIAELEVANAELKQLLRDVEGERSESLQRSRDSAVAVMKAVEVLAESALREPSSKAAMVDSMETDAILSHCLCVADSCQESLAFIAGNCSDIAEAVGFKEFAEREGSFARIEECIGKVAEVAREKEAVLEDYEFVRRQLEETYASAVELQDALRASEDEAIALTEQLSVAKAEVAQVSLSLEVSRAACDQRSQELLALRESIGAESENSVIAEGKVAALEGSLSELEDQYHAAMQEMVQLRQAVAEREELCESLEMRLHEKEGVILSSQATLDQLSGAVRELQEHKALAVEAFKAEIEELKASTSSISQEGESLTEQVQQLQAALQAEVAAKEALAMQLEVTAAENAVMTAASEELVTKCGGLETELAAARDRLGAVAGHEELQAALAAEVNAKEAAIAQLAQVSSELTNLSASSGALAIKCGEIEVELDAARDELTARNGALAGHEELQAALAAEGNAKEAAIAQSTELSKELTTLRATYDALAVKCGGLEAELEAAAAEFGSYKAEVDSLALQDKQQILALIAERDSLRSSSVPSDAADKLLASEAECVRLRSVVDDAQFTIENLTNAVEAELRALNAAKTDYDSQIAAVNNAKTAAEEDNDRLQQDQLVMLTFFEALFSQSEMLMDRADFTLAAFDAKALDAFFESYLSGLKVVQAYLVEEENKTLSANEAISKLSRAVDLQANVVGDLLSWAQDLPIPQETSAFVQGVPDSSRVLQDESWLKDLDEITSALVSMKQLIREGLVAAHRSAAVETPAVKTPAKWNQAARLLDSLTPDGKDMARLHSEIVKERRSFAELKESYSDLLELLAQQELELSVFRGKVSIAMGQKALEDAEDEVRKQAIDKYGSYTNIRG